MSCTALVAAAFEFEFAAAVALALAATWRARREPRAKSMLRENCECRGMSCAMAAGMGTWQG